MDLFLSSSAQTAIQNYVWPGNVREMENVIERAVILAENQEIDAYDLHFSNMEVPMENSANLTLEEMEREMIQKALRRHLGNISKAADELGITRAALYRRMEKFNLM